MSGDRDSSEFLGALCRKGSMYTVLSGEGIKHIIAMGVWTQPKLKFRPQPKPSLIYICFVFIQVTSRPHRMAYVAIIQPYDYADNDSLKI